MAIITPFLSDTSSLLTKQGIEPDYVLPTEDNGFSVEFRYKSSYYLVECWPTGEVVFIKKQDRQIDTWDLKMDNYLPTLNAQLTAEIITHDEA